MASGWTRRDSFKLLGLLALAAALRFNDLAGESLWYDEAYSVWSSRMDILSPRVLWEWRIEFPVYYWLLHVWMRLFGDGQVAVRSLSAVAGALSVVPMVGWGRRLFGERAGWAAGLMLAVSPYHIWYSQEARMYACAVLLALVSSYAFWRLVQGARWPWWAVHALSTGLTFSLHYYVGWLVLSQNLFMAVWTWSKHPTWRRWWRAMLPWIGEQLLVLLLALPAFAVFWHKAAGLNQWGWLSERYGAPGLRSLVGLFSTFVVGSTYRGPSWLRWVILLGFALVIAWGAWATWRKRSEGHTTWAWGLAAGSLLLAVGAVFLLGQFRPIWVPRYLLLFLPSLLLLVACGLSAVSGRWGDVLFALLVLGSASGLVGLYGEQQKEDWRGVARLLLAERRADEALILMDGECRVPYAYYAPEDDPLRLEVSRFADGSALDEAVDRVSVQESGERLWVLVSHAEAEGLVSRLDSAAGWQREATPQFVGIELYRYARAEGSK